MGSHITFGNSEINQLSYLNLAIDFLLTLYPIIFNNPQSTNSMKTYITRISTLLAIIALALTACKTSENANSLADKKEDVKKKTMVRDDVPATSMAELLRRQSSLTVTGSGDNINVQIRGSRSFNSTNEPLYIIEGRRMGHDYRSIAGIAPADVKRINVIRDPAELSSYGVGASNGVIEIFLKK